MKLVLLAALAAASCVPPARAGDPEADIRAIVARIAGVSRYPLRRRVKVYYFAPGRSGTDIDGKPFIGVPEEFEISSAGTLAPHQGRNAGQDPVIWVNQSMMSRPGDGDEVASILSHELAHLELGHFRRYEKRYCALFDAWMRGRPKPRRLCPARTSQDEADFWNGAAGARAELEALSRAHEDAADERGAALLSAAGFDPAAPVRYLVRLQGIYDAKGLSQDAQHATPMQRAERLIRLGYPAR